MSTRDSSVDGQSEQVGAPGRYRADDVARVFDDVDDPVEAGSSVRLDLIEQRARGVASDPVAGRSAGQEIEQPQQYAEHEWFPTDLAVREDPVRNSVRAAIARTEVEPIHVETIAPEILVQPQEGADGIAIDRRKQ